MQICVQFDDPRAAERVTMVSTFSVPLTDCFSEVHMQPEETVVILGKLLSCQQDVLEYKYYIAKATQELMGNIQRSAAQDSNYNVLLQYLHRFYECYLFVPDSQIMRSLLRNYFLTADSAQIVRSLNQEAFWCTERSIRSVRVVKPELLEAPQTAVVLSSFTQTRIFVCINDLEPDCLATVDVGSEHSSRLNTPRTPRTTAGFELASLDHYIARAVRYLGGDAAYETKTVFTMSAHADAIRSLLTDEGATYEEWLQDVQRLH